MGGGGRGSGGAGGALGAVDQGGADGGIACLAGERPRFGCSNSFEGACYHDPLPADCDSATGKWVCSFGTVPAPAHDCAGSGGVGGRQCDPLPTLAAGGASGAGGAPSGQIVSLGAATSYPSGGPPLQMALADLDGDGRLDILVTTTSSDTGSTVGGVSVLLNQGGGTFAPARSYGMSAAAQTYLAVADVNGDGKSDVVVTGGLVGATSSADVLLNNGDGTLAAPIHEEIGVSPSNVVIADVDGDGRNDLVVAFSTYPSGGGMAVLSNRGDGTFAAARTYPAGSRPGALAVGDLDGDSKPDVAVVSYDGQVPGVQENLSVLLNRGGGNFAPAIAYPAGEFLTSVTMGDLDGDGDRDILVLDSYSRLAGLMNHGDGTFATPVPYAGDGAISAVALGDVTGDGRVDIVAANNLAYGSGGWLGGNVSVLVNGGNGVFGPPIDFADEPIERSLVLGDLNGDGKLDVVAVNHSFACMDTISVLLNTSP